MARAKADESVKDEPLEMKLGKSADKLRKDIDAAEYKHMVLGLHFLKHISDSFEALHAKARSADVLGHVFEYFVGDFTLAQGKQAGQFFTSGRYVGPPDEEEDFSVAERFEALKADFEVQLREEARLNAATADNLAKMKL